MIPSELSIKNLIEKITVYAEPGSIATDSMGEVGGRDGSGVVETEVSSQELGWYEIYPEEKFNQFAPKWVSDTKNIGNSGNINPSSDRNAGWGGETSWVERKITTEFW